MPEKDTVIKAEKRYKMEMRYLMILLTLIALPMLAKAATYGAADVAMHSTDSDCWIVVEGKVYDFTPITSLHDSQVQCGKDNTDSNLSVLKAASGLSSYYIGDLAGKESKRQ